MKGDLFLQHGAEVDLPTAVRYILRLAKELPTAIRYILILAKELL